MEDKNFYQRFNEDCTCNAEESCTCPPKGRCITVCGVPGPRGPQGERGETGPAGRPCNTCELLVNPSFEDWAVLPRGWHSCHIEADRGIERATARGLVHTGRSAVALSHDGCIYQTVRDVRGDRCYEFSFFAKSDDCNAGLTAEVLFETKHQGVRGAVVEIRRGDINTQCSGYGYYRVTTCKAPDHTVSATVRFRAETDEIGNVYIDDVSFR